MTAQVLPFTGITTLDVEPISVLDAAKEAGLAEVVICGIDADGNEYFASSVADGAAAAWHLDRARWALMRQVDRMVEGEE